MADPAALSTHTNKSKTKTKDHPHNTHLITL